jgi:outer membrane lipoprotein SlyB
MVIVMQLNRSKMFLAGSAVFAALLLGACAPQQRSDVYYAPQAMRPQNVALGTVEGVRPVQINAPNTGVGTVGGAAIGGIAGSTMGGSYNANAAGAIAGAIIGGIAGTAIEQSANKRNGVEITVHLDSGQMIAIVQEDVGDAYRPGDRVRVLSDGYTTRVSH